MSPTLSSTNVEILEGYRRAWTVSISLILRGKVCKIGCVQGADPSVEPSFLFGHKGYEEQGKRSVRLSSPEDITDHLSLNSAELNLRVLKTLMEHDRGISFPIPFHLYSPEGILNFIDLI